MRDNMTREEMVEIVALSDKIDSDLAALKRDLLQMELEYPITMMRLEFPDRPSVVKEVR